MQAETGAVLNTLYIKTSNYIVEAVALVAALSWNDTVKGLITRYIPLPDDKVYAQVIYAAIITLILVLLILFLPDSATSSSTKSPQKKIQDAKERAALYKRINDLETKLNQVSAQQRSSVIYVAPPSPNAP